MTKRFSGTETDVVAREHLEQSLVARFAYQVRRHPNKTAVQTLTNAATYTQLDQLSNRIAHILLDADVRIYAAPVLLAIDDELKLIAAILGVLKAGGLYVPLDPNLPEIVAQQIVQDVQAPLALAEVSRLPMVEHAHAMTTLDLDRALQNARKFDDPGLAIEPDDNAYIYYTSGSTGAPKGVFDSHRNVMHNVMRYTGNLDITAADRITLLQSCGFSGAVSNIFCALLNGATLLPFDVRRHGVARLATWLGETRATIYHSVPSLFRHILRHDADLTTLRVVRLEGDHASPGDVEGFRAHCPAGCILAHGLGATETGLSSQAIIDPLSNIHGTAVPVGVATADMFTEIVDDRGTPLPDGEIGEVVVRSAYLACGYWRKPHLTAQAFRAAPGGRRRYFSGDLGKIENGSLVLCGRKDSQLKIDGRWVDTSLMESALQSMPGVRDALVSAVENRNGRLATAAFYVARADIDSTEAREQLERAAGISNLPISIIGIEEWPLNANGKIDQHALQALAAKHQAIYEPPTTHIQKEVAAVVQATLGIDAPIGIDDDFYHLGGDSLTAAEIATSLSEKFATQTPMAAFMRNPTVRGLADAIVEQKNTDHMLVELQAGGTQTPIYCVHAHMGHVFNLRRFARQFHDRPIYGIQARGMDGRERPHSNVVDMARDYVNCMRAHQPQGPYLVAGYCFGGLVATEMARELSAQGEQVERLILIDTDCPSLSHTPRALSRAPRAWREAARKLFVPNKAMNRLRHRTTELAGKVLCKTVLPAWRYALARGCYLPAFALTPSFAIRLINSDFKPARYNGSSLLVQTTNSDTARDWKAYLSDTVSIASIECSSAQLMRSPHVEELAALMQSELGPA